MMNVHSDLPMTLADVVSRLPLSFADRCRLRETWWALNSPLDRPRMLQAVVESYEQAVAANDPRRKHQGRKLIDQQQAGARAARATMNAWRERKPTPFIRGKPMTLADAESRLPLSVTDRCRRPGIRT